MVAILNYPPPIGSPLAQADTVVIPRIVDPAAGPRSSRREAFQSALWHLAGVLLHLLRRVWRYHPVITTYRRFDLALCREHTAGALDTYARMAADPSIARDVAVSRANLAGRDEQMSLLRWYLNNRGASSVVAVVKGWPAGGAR